MKLVLFSDSHGNVANMADVVRLEHPDRVLHMGDLARDAEELARQFPDIPVTYVPGNCDGRRPDLPDERRFTLEGCKILMTHGHTYHVKAGPGAAIRAARETGARLLCFGHTHEAFCEFQNGLWIVNPGAAGSLERSSMLLVIDVGNTNMEFGVYRGEELVGSFRLMTDANRTSDELGLWLCQYFQRFGLELGQVEDVVIGSVAPQVMHTLSRAVQKYVGKTPLVLDEALDPGLPYVECDSDERLGPDRAAADIAAIAKYGAPLVVLDFGTATTLDAVSREGVYLGGCITAGVQVSIDGLFQKTALLVIIVPLTLLGVLASGPLLTLIRVPQEAYEQARTYCMVVLGTLVCLAMSAVVLPLRRPLLMLFNREPGVVAAGEAYLLRALSLMFILAMMFIMNGVLRGAGATTVPMVASIISLWAARIPVAYALAYFFGPEEIYWAYPIGWALGLLICVVSYFCGRWKDKCIVSQAPQE